MVNDKADHKALIAWMCPDVVRVVHEPTGPYHRKMEHALAAAGLPLVKVNPRQARRFFEGVGQLTKTDRLDAAMLARMGSLLEIAPRLLRSEHLNELKDLDMAREALLKHCNAERLKQIERQMATIEAEIMAGIESDADLAASFAILPSIPGVSTITAFALIIDMQELGTLGRRTFM